VSAGLASPITHSSLFVLDFLRARVVGCKGFSRGRGGTHVFQTKARRQFAGAVSETDLARSLAIADRAAYPFCVPFLRDDFELDFDRPITIIAGENGTGKSTLLEGIAVLAGYDQAGGGKGYRPVDHVSNFG
jgi:hypothetical protein